MQSGRPRVIILQANKFFFEKGGSERYMFALCDALTGRGHELLHFSMAHPHNRPSQQSGYFVPQRDYDGPLRPASVPALLNFVWSREAARRLDALLSERLPDVAHMHNIYHQLTPSIIAALSRRGVPVVMTLHDYKLVCPSYGMFAHGEPCYRCRGGRYHHAVTVGCGGSRARSAMLATEAYWQKRTRVYDLVDCFIAPSAYMRDVMVDSGIAPERVIHIPQLSPEAGVPEALSEDEQRLLADLPARFVMYAGRVSAEKGVDVLVEAMSRIREVPLVIFGEGPMAAPLRRACEKAAAKNVYFAGHASRTVLEHAFARTEALVVPSLWAENAPMVVLEAARAGAPVIATDRGGLPELAGRAGGSIVPAGDAAALADAIRSVWENTDEWKARVRTAWDANRAAHEAANHVRAIEAIYQRAITRRRAA